MACLISNENSFKKENFLKYCNDLLNDNKILHQVIEQLSFKEDTIKQFKLGLYKNLLIIPIYNPRNELINIECKFLDNIENPKDNPDINKQFKNTKNDFVCFNSSLDFKLENGILIIMKDSIDCLRACKNVNFDNNYCFTTYESALKHKDCIKKYNKVIINLGNHYKDRELQEEFSKILDFNLYTVDYDSIIENNKIKTFKELYQASNENIFDDNNLILTRNSVFKKYIKNNNNLFDKTKSIDIDSEDIKSMKYFKTHDIIEFKNNYFNIEIDKKTVCVKCNNTKCQCNEGLKEAIAIKYTRKSNYILNINRKVIENTIKTESSNIEYFTEFKVELKTSLNKNKTFIIPQKNLYENKPLQEEIKSHGIHISTLKDVDNKNIIERQLKQDVKTLNVFKNPGIIKINNNKLWLYNNACVDLKGKKVYTVNDKGYIVYNNDTEIKLESNSHKPNLLIINNEQESLLHKLDCIQNIKHNKCLKSQNPTNEELITSALILNLMESYNYNASMFLNLGLAILSPFVDIVFNKYNMYPVGFIHGEAESGKSNSLIIKACIFGYNKNFLASGNDTFKNIVHRSQEYINTPILYPETGTDIRKKFDDYVKMIFDRTTRSMMQDGTTETKKPIKTTFFFASNNILHTKPEIATRLLFTTLLKTDFKPDNALKLNELRDAGFLSCILPEILKTSEADLLSLLDSNIDDIKSINSDLSSRVITNLAIAKTGMDLIFKVSAFDLDLLKENNGYIKLMESYNSLINGYNNDIQTKDSFTIFLEILPLLLRNNTIEKNTDFTNTSIEGKDYLAIHLHGNVYQNFKKEFKACNTYNEEIPREDRIKQEAKKQGHIIGKTVRFKNGGVQKCLCIDYKKSEYLLNTIKPLTW